eukprot:Lankesteria_metandrocarpae@DN4108_c0_g1_i1.p1
MGKYPSIFDKCSLALSPMTSSPSGDCQENATFRSNHSASNRLENRSRLLARPSAPPVSEVSTPCSKLTTGSFCADSHTRTAPIQTISDSYANNSKEYDGKLHHGRNQFRAAEWNRRDEDHKDTSSTGVFSSSSSSSISYYLPSRKNRKGNLNKSGSINTNSGGCSGGANSKYLSTVVGSALRAVVGANNKLQNHRNTKSTTSSISGSRHEYQGQQLHRDKHVIVPSASNTKQQCNFISQQDVSAASISAEDGNHVECIPAEHNNTDVAHRTVVIQDTDPSVRPTTAPPPTAMQHKVALSNSSGQYNKNRGRRSVGSVLHRHWIEFIKRQGKLLTWSKLSNSVSGLYAAAVLKGALVTIGFALCMGSVWPPGLISLAAVAFGATASRRKTYSGFVLSTGMLTFLIIPLLYYAVSPKQRRVITAARQERSNGQPSELLYDPIHWQPFSTTNAEGGLRIARVHHDGYNNVFTTKNRDIALAMESAPVLQSVPTLQSAPALESAPLWPSVLVASVFTKDCLPICPLSG